MSHHSVAQNIGNVGSPADGPYHALQPDVVHSMMAARHVAAAPTTNAMPQHMRPQPPTGGDAVGSVPLGPPGSGPLAMPIGYGPGPWHAYQTPGLWQRMFGKTVQWDDGMGGVHGYVGGQGCDQYGDAFGHSRYKVNGVLQLA